MKNITAQYRDLLEGKMTKANFMANVRMQFPDYISPVNSYEDMVKILKSKRILSEIEDLTKTTAQLDAEGDKKAFYLVDETGDVIDSVMAVDSQEASDYFEKEYEGIGSSLTVIHTSNPDELRGGVAEDIDKKDIEAVQAGALKEGDAYQMGLDANQRGDNHDKCPYEAGTPEADLWMDGWMDHETAKQMSHDEDTYNRETGGYGDLYKESLNEAADTITVLRDLYYFDKLNTLAAKEDVDAKYHNYGTLWAEKGDSFDTGSEEHDMIMNSSRLEKGKDYTTGQMKESLNEAVEKPEGSYKKVTGKDLYSFFNEIDRVNPYEVKKGIAIEMGMQYQPVPNYFTDDFNPESLAKATRKVLKNLQKDPAYYTNMISLPTEKRTNMLQKPAEVKVKADGHTKIKGFTDEKGNTEENLGKKERAKGSPEGVKEMKPSKKSMGGLKTMKSNDKLPKGVELMKEADLTNSPAGLNAIGTSDLAARAKEIYKQQEEERKKQNQKAKAAPATEEGDMKSKLKELVMQEVKKRLEKKSHEMVKEKVTTQDVAQAAATGETLNIPSSDNQAIQAAKSKKVTFTTYE